MTRVRSKAVLVLLALAGALGSGCVEGNVSDFVRYDSSTDSFKHLQLYTGLHSSNLLDIRHGIDPHSARQQDLQHLADLWSRRNETITNPIEFRLFSGPTVYERTGKHTYRPWPTHRAPHKTPKEESSPVDLDSIRILPGQFFLTEDKRLACYQQVIVPGKTVDQLLQYTVRPWLIDRLARGAKEEIQKSGKPNVRCLTWPETRKELADDLLLKKPAKNKPKEKPQKPAKNKPKEKPQEIVGPFDVVTLKMWSAPAADESVKLWRVRDRFTARIPLSPDDSSEVVATISFLKQEIAQHVGPLPDNELQPFGRLLVELVQVREIKGIGIEVTLNLTALLGRLMERTPRRRQHKVEDKDPREKVYQETVSFIRDKGIPINERLTVHDLTAEYTDSALASLFRGWGPLWLSWCLVVFLLSVWAFVRSDRDGIVQRGRLRVGGNVLAVALVATLVSAGVLSALLEIPDWWLPLLQMSSGKGRFVIGLGLAGLTTLWAVGLFLRVKQTGRLPRRRQVLRPLFFATCIELLLALAVSVHVWNRDLGASAVESWTGLLFGLLALVWLGVVCGCLLLLRWRASRQALLALPPLPSEASPNQSEGAIQAEFSLSQPEEERFPSCIS